MVLFVRIKHLVDYLCQPLAKREIILMLHGHIDKMISVFRLERDSTRDVNRPLLFITPAHKCIGQTCI